MGGITSVQPRSSLYALIHFIQSGLYHMMSFTALKDLERYVNALTDTVHSLVQHMPSTATPHPPMDAKEKMDSPLVQPFNICFRDINPSPPAHGPMREESLLDNSLETLEQPPQIKNVCQPRAPTASEGRGPDAGTEQPTASQTAASEECDPDAETEQQTTSQTARRVALEDAYQPTGSEIENAFQTAGAAWEESYPASAEGIEIACQTAEAAWGMPPQAVGAEIEIPYQPPTANAEFHALAPAVEEYYPDEGFGDELDCPTAEDIYALLVKELVPSNVTLVPAQTSMDPVAAEYIQVVARTRKRKQTLVTRSYDLRPRIKKVK